MTVKENTRNPLLHLNFYHHSILIRCNESALIEKLREEFDFFLDTEEPGEDRTEISLVLAPPNEFPPMVAVKILDQGTVYRLGTLQYVDYFGEALSIQDFQEKTVEIQSENQDRLFELAYLAIHSIAGQNLEKDGLCRIHGLGVSLGETNAIVMLPSKGGKSTLLSLLFENPDVKVISDDMPLCDYAGRVYSFPSKMSLDEIPSKGILSKLHWRQFRRHHYPPKWTASLQNLKERISGSPENNRTLLIAGHRLSQGQSILVQVSKWKMIRPVFEHMILGLGLPQIIEMLLRFNLTDFVRLPYLALIRTICAFNLVRKSHCFYFYMGPDKTYNSQLLLDLLYDQQST